MCKVDNIIRDSYKRGAQYLALKEKCIDMSKHERLVSLLWKPNMKTNVNNLNLLSTVEEMLHFLDVV